MRRSAATSVSPLASRRPTISPTSRRSTASGLAMTKVRSFMLRRLFGAHVGSGLTHHIERASDEDGVVVAGHRDRAVDGQLDVGFEDDVDTERAGDVAELRGVERAR